MPKAICDMVPLRVVWSFFAGKPDQLSLLRKILNMARHSSISSIKQYQTAHP